MHSQTFFETARGISAVEVTTGHSLIIVSGVEECEGPMRALDGLRALKDSGVSFDFLKVAPHGFSFVVPEGLSDQTVSALCGRGLDAKAIRGRAIITARVPNIRDESGLVARIAQVVVRAGATIDHVGDMHSSVQLVVDSSKADGAVEALRACTGKVEIV